MDAKLKQSLPQLKLETLHHLDRGKLARQFQRAIARTLQNITEFPCRGDKPETREIVLRIRITPEVKFEKTAVETAYGHSEASVPRIVGLSINADIKDKLPIFQTDDVRFVVEMINGQITDARFNPANNINPAQLDLFDDDAEPTDDA